jgi:hypothetical protein
MKKIPLKNILRYAINYCGNDERKLKLIINFIENLIERKIESTYIDQEDELYFGEQKKIELKVDEDVIRFARLAEEKGKSASGLLCELICEKFGINAKISTRKPKEKKLNGTISLKIPMHICRKIEKIARGMKISEIAREIIKEANEEIGKTNRNEKIRSSAFKNSAIN